MDEARGAWFETEDGHTFWWPRCIVSGCKHHICIGLSDRYCHPHSQVGRIINAALKTANLELAEHKVVA